MLDALKSYTEKNGMTLNLKKTKVMIFNKSGRHMRRNFYFGDDKLETTRQYKYLGFIVTPSGEITTGLNDLRDRALKAFMKMKKIQGISFRRYPLITLKLFSALIEPILLYASDFWGILKLPKNNPIENVFISFCKQLLGVQKQTTNVGVLLQLGKVPLSLLAQKRCLKNWSRIVNNIKCNSMVTMSHENAILENLTWTTSIENKLSEIGMRELFLGKDKEIHTKASQRMNDIFYQGAFFSIQQEDSKLRTYSLFKTSIGYEEYLSKNQNIKERISLTKLRLSNHLLMIEKGRHEKIERDSRFCPFCPQQVEDEQHFLIDCECYTGYRNILFQKIAETVISFPYIDKAQQFSILMNTSNNTSNLTAQFISKAMILRESLIP